MTITPKLNIALPGKSAFSTEPRDFAFSSDYSTVRIFKEAKSSVSVASGGSSTVTIDHDLGFVPMCMVFVEFATGHYYCGVGLANKVDGFPGGYISVSPNPAFTYADTADLVFTIVNTSGTTRTINYHYYIFADDGI
jgi:hypothetical protein